MRISSTCSRITIHTDCGMSRLTNNRTYHIGSGQKTRPKSQHRFIHCNNTSTKQSNIVTNLQLKLQPASSFLILESALSSMYENKGRQIWHMHVHDKQHTKRTHDQTLWHAEPFRSSYFEISMYKMNACRGAIKFRWSKNELF